MIFSPVILGAHGQVMCNSNCFSCDYRMYLYTFFTDSLSGFAQSCVSVILGPVVQSIVSLTTSLSCQFVRYIPTILPNPLLFFVVKM